MQQNGNIDAPAQIKKRPRFFYGWIIVGVMAVVGAFTPAMATLNFGLFIKIMGDELGIGRSMFGWAITTRQVAGSASGPILGRLIDRFGSRVILVIATVLTGAGMVGLSFTVQSWQLVLMFGIMGITGFGVPGGALVTSIPIFKWFVHNRGKAVSFSSLGIPLGALIFIPLTQILITSRGWREAWIILAVITMAVVVPLSLIFVRRQPEDMGLQPDGSSSTHDHPLDTDSPVTVRDEIAWTAHEAVHTGAFWRLVVAFSFMFLAMGSVGLHRIPAFMDRGLDPRLISYATAFDATMAGTSMFISGLLVRRFPARFVGVVSFSLLAMATVLTIHAYSLPIMFLSMAIFGFGIGGMTFSSSFLWAEYYGRHHLGSIRGIVAPITLIVGGIGPPLAGYIRDTTGRYDPMWWTSVGLMALSAVILVTTQAPRKAEVKSQTATTIT
ncbi:MFS transporter [Chloroflexota bacterium]